MNGYIHLLTNKKADRKASLKHTLLLLFLCFCVCTSKAQDTSDSAFVRNHYIKKEQYITMRDGVKLFTSIYLPKDQSKKYPILLNRTPYTVAPYGKDSYKKTLGPSMLLARDGYIFVYQDVRGKWMSEGTFKDVTPHIPVKKTKKEVDESSDTYDTIDWLVKNLPNNNGKVGMYGISYPGFYSTAALPGAHKALKAVSPQAPVTDWFIGDDFHHNGALFLADAFGFTYLFNQPRPKPITPDQGPAAFSFPTRDSYKFFLELGPVKNVKERYFGDSISFWNDMVKHPNYDSYWKARNITKHLFNIKPATLVVGGFFDAEDTWGALATYQAIEKQNKHHSNTLVMGPWFHGGWARSTGEKFGDIAFGQPTSTWYLQNVELPFFRHHLKGGPDPQLAEAIVFETGSNQWKKYSVWPPAEYKATNYYLRANGKLSLSAPTQASSFDEYQSDPSKPVPFDDGTRLNRRREYMIADQRFASRRPDVMVYQSDVLTRDVTLSGPVIADLIVSTTGTDADYVVKLIDVYPDDYPNPKPNTENVEMSGYQMLVRAEVMRGRYRNSLEKPEAIAANQPTRVKYTLPDVAHTFKAGHKIMIQIQNSWFPLVDRNPQKYVDIYNANESDFQKAMHRIYHQAGKESKIVLPVMPAGKP